MTIQAIANTAARDAGFHFESFADRVGMIFLIALGFVTAAGVAVVGL